MAESKNSTGAVVKLVVSIAAIVVGLFLVFGATTPAIADGVFVGSISLVLAIYLWLFDASVMVSTISLAGLSLAVFVRLKYLYPSKLEPRGLRRALALGGIVWAAGVGFAVYALGDVAEKIISVAGPVAAGLTVAAIVAFVVWRRQVGKQYRARP